MPFKEVSGSSNKLLEVIRAVADYQFGRGVGKKLFPDGCTVKVSRRTGRPRYIYHGGELLATVRYPDNLLALTLSGAERLAKIVPKPRMRVVLKPEALPKLSKGMNPTAADLYMADENLLPGDEVLIEDREGRLIGVGRAAVSGSTMRELASGVVVKVRKIRKG